MTSSRKRVLALVAVATLSLGVAFVAKGATLHESGGAITAVRVASSNERFWFTDFGDSTTWHGVPGAKVKVSVPGGTDALLLLRFSAESACWSLSFSEGSASPGRGWCSVRILVDGVPAQPASGKDFAFDSTSDANDSRGSWEGHAMERWFFAGAGTHVVKVQALVRSTVSAETLGFSLDEWVLVAERAAR
jgi:hypothetical protein